MRMSSLQISGAGLVAMTWAGHHGSVVGQRSGEAKMSYHGETPARRALRESTVAASGAVQRSLPLILQYLRMTTNQMDGMTMSGWRRVQGRAGFPWVQR